MRVKILVCATGSIAAIKTLEVATKLRDFECDVRLAGTKSAEYFINHHFGLDYIEMFRDGHEWPNDYKIGDPVLHIRLRSWADVLVIAPCSANSLAKISYGLADNLVTCIARAWDFNKPCFLAPAMNTMMWDNPVTVEHLDKVQRRGFFIIDPIVKKLACGDTGIGAMADPNTIVNYIRQVV